MLKFKNLALIAIISVFFDAFVFPIGKHFAFVMYLIIIPVLLMYAYSKNLKLINEFYFLFKKTPFKYLLYFVIYLFLSAIVLIFQRISRPLIFYYLAIKFIPATILIYILTVCFIPKYIKIKRFISVFFSFLFFILVWGIVGFIADLYNIHFLQAIVNAFSNLKQLTEGTEIMLDQVSGLPRARSIFHEPGSLNKLLIIFMPIIYNICLSKYRLYKNKYVNFIIKYSIIPLMWTNIMLIMSPIYIIYSLIITLIYFRKTLLLLIIKYFYIILLFLSFIILIYLFDTSTIEYLIKKTFLKRIVLVINNINDLPALIQAEESLGSRITSYLNSFILFLKKPFIGYGYDNVRFYMFEQFMQSPIPLTRENIRNISFSYITNAGVGYNRSLLFGLLPETGIIGTILYYLFLFKNITFINEIKSNFYNLELAFLNGICGSIWIIIILSFYIYSFATHYIYVLYGLIASYAIQNYINKKGMINKL